MLTSEQIQRFIELNSAWSVKTFGNSTALPVVEHLKDEAKELRNAIRDKESEEAIKFEFADCFILLLQAAQKSGITFEDLFFAAKAKFKINKKRIWAKPDSLGRCHHID